MTKIKVLRIPVLNTLVIKQDGGNDFFITAHNGIIISIENLSFILSFLVKNNFLSKKVLEGILQDARED